MAEACLATELEALSATFEGVVWDSQQRSVRVSILPYTDADVFLTCTLVLDLTDYPAAGVNVLLEGVKGFSDSQELQLVEALRGLVQDGGDEAGLLPLVASALDQVTEWNRPSGTCVLCLEALDDVPAAQACLLPCLHCFHRTCFLSYAAWQQDRLARRAEEIAEQWKAAAPAQLAKEGVAADAATGAYAMPCPCCRAVALRRLQRTQRATLEAQRRAGGLVGTRVAVTLAELEASRQAARDTASAAVAEPRDVRQAVRVKERENTATGTPPPAAARALQARS
ncbi:E3 ubiquitin-protein ligase RNF25 [Auxenochlorella protothecoides]|uniref:E3 ubiquitin-protein ligase RNF25 n=1 Tax=Auxenochlorella protothecoides TaxID=3075 RepID=A0A087SKH2_AUXPR|nr:E3 ubiquitin-protein ligase RNF25 [Auxenochlorella protothecoides]KFM26226.1 E3 ubiquitin-protein ligase RNF25 [Auxenochlorella protothecoides]